MRGTVSEPQRSLNALEDSGKTAMRGGLITGRGCLTLSSDAESFALATVNPSRESSINACKRPRVISESVFDVEPRKPTADRMSFLLVEDSGRSSAAKCG